MKDIFLLFYIENFSFKLVWTRKKVGSFVIQFIIFI